jgi:mannose-6-phosphate isomerase-like protein (cupin superfamily)
VALIWVKNIEEETGANTTFRTALWTGKHSQLTVMSLGAGAEIGLEVHPDVDQFFRLEQGSARVEVGNTRDELSETYEVKDDWAFIVPAGTWHNVINIGDGGTKAVHHLLSFQPSSGDRARDQGGCRRRRAS